MTTGHVFIATSLDGFIARPDGSLDWLTGVHTDGEDHGYDRFIADMDGIVMGRETFQTILGFGDWPYKKPVIVLSHSLTEADIPEACQGRVTLSTQDPRALMASLSAQGWSKAYIDGGAVIRSFIKDGLISEITITQLPILIGQGRRLFGSLQQDMTLDCLAVNHFPSGLVQVRYHLT